MARVALVNGDEELAALGVKDSGDSLVARYSWLVARDSWLVTRDSWLVTRDSWLVARDSWLVARDSWLVTRGSNCVLRNDLGCVSGNYVQCIDRNNFCGVGQVHCLGHGYSYTQAGKTARADRNINMPDFFGLPAEAVQQTTNSRENLRTVPHRAGKGSSSKYLPAKRYRNRTCPAGRFNG